jgi:uncharacterized OsmC-like protein
MARPAGREAPASGGRALAAGLAGLVAASAVSGGVYGGATPLELVVLALAGAGVGGALAVAIGLQL